MSESDGDPIHRDRSRARAWAVQILYQWEIAGEGSPRSVLGQTLGRRTVGPVRVPYIRRLIDGYDEHRTDVDEALSAALKNWRLGRLAALDRAILRVAATELLYFADIPHGVAVHEAVLLAERYSGSDSPPFVNGVLEALVRLRPAGSARSP